MMLFKPNFCCSCGEKIERAEWGLLTSRRFCDVCASEHQKYDWLPRVIVSLGILAGVFGVGIWMGEPIQPQMMPLSTAPAAPVRKFEVGANGKNGIKKGDAAEPMVSEHDVIPASAAPVPALDQGPPGSVSSQEQVYYCGAMTKKGTPCSRRVKQKGARCWQHIGKPPALLSQTAPDVY